MTAPWAITAHVTEEDCRPYIPIPTQVIAYHVVTEGSALVSLDSGVGYREHFRAQPGDVIVLPANPMHVLASDLGHGLVSGDDILFADEDQGLVQIRHGGGGARTQILCGFIASNSGPNPLLETLPEVLIVNIADLPTRRWIEASIAIASHESGSRRMSSQSVVAQLSELLLVEALSAYLETATRPAGWLAGMSDPRIAPALAYIHETLAEPPQVTELAAKVGLSRSAFVDRFTEVMGVSPRRYAMTHRMQTAEMLLRDTELAMAEIAYRVGYNAPEAFSRAFKRETGKSPLDWRETVSG